MQQQQSEIKVDVKMNNVVFKCDFCTTIYNNKEMKPIAIAQILGVVQNPNGTMSVQMGSFLVCEKCFKLNKFSEPLNILIPPSPTINIKNN